MNKCAQMFDKENENTQSSDAIKWLDRDDALSQLQSHIQLFLRDAEEWHQAGSNEAPPVLGMKVSAGLGKTRSTLEGIAEQGEEILKHGHIFIYVPTLDLADQAARDFEGFNSGLPHMVLRGRSFSNLDGFRDGLRFLKAKGWTRQPCLGIVLTDGDLLDCELADCFELDQTNIEAFLNALENWGDEEKAKVIIAMTDNIVDFRIDRDTPDSTRIAFAEYDNFQDLAEDHVEQGLIPGLSTETAPTHIDWDAVIRDLSQNYFEATIAGRCVIYRDD